MSFWIKLFTVWSNYLVFLLVFLFILINVSYTADKNFLFCYHCSASKRCYSNNKFMQLLGECSQLTVFHQCSDFVLTVLFREKWSSTRFLQALTKALLFSISQFPFCKVLTVMVLFLALLELSVTTFTFTVLTGITPSKGWAWFWLRPQSVAAINEQ